MKIGWAPWMNFINRDLIAKFDLKYPPFRISDDFIFSFFLLCSAEKYLLQPEPFYVYRVHSNSVMHHGMKVDEIIHHRIGEFFKGLKIIDDFMKKFKFFEEHPENKYAVFNFFAINAGLEGVVVRLYEKFPAAQLDKLIREELKKIDDISAATAFLFSRMSIFSINLIRKQQIIQQLQK